MNYLTYQVPGCQESETILDLSEIFGNVMNPTVLELAG